MATNTNKVIWGRELKYVIPRAMYENLRDEAPKNVNAKDWIMDYINQTYGLLGTITELYIEGEALERGHRAEISPIDELF